MPELPDVETFRRYLSATSLHKKIKAVNIRSPEILEEVSADQLKEDLKGKHFETTVRHGKYLGVFLDSSKCLVMHFGMTGFLKYFMKAEKEPPHERLLISFTNGYHLAYDCQRKLGQITLADDFNQFIEDKNLGPDALASDLDFNTFKKAIIRRRASIKSVLINQKVIAGVGNVYSDEILFQAQIHPKIRGEQLRDEQLRRLFAAREKVLKTAIAHQANPENFPPSYITRDRSGSGKCPKCKRQLKKTRISGRTAYYCANCQKP
jgi:formamidopyrimidine-DNA glycosylase|nr:Fpg/Nei family DNA glycosylase [Deltaproteobacteria bacterium]